MRDNTHYVEWNNLQLLMMEYHNNNNNNEKKCIKSYK